MEPADDLAATTTTTADEDVNGSTPEEDHLEASQMKKKAPDSPKQRKYNHISDYIHGADCSDLVKLTLRTSKKSHSQPSLLPFSNFEFCNVVFVPTREAMLSLRKQTEVKELRGRGQKKLTRFGVFLSEPQDPGVFIDVFLGHTHLFSTLVERAGNKLMQPCSQTFVLVPAAPEGLSIDARRSGNEMRFIRRSCRPNVTIKPILVESDRSLHIGIFTMNGVKHMEELYAPLDGLPLFKYECACGNPELCLAPIDLVPEAKGSVDSRFSLEPPISQTIATVSSIPRHPPDRKLSREERKLQRYIEFFEKMDASDTATTTKQPRKKSVRSAEISAHPPPATPAAARQTSSPTKSPVSSVPSSPKHLKKQWLQTIAAPTPQLSTADSDHLIDVVGMGTPAASLSTTAVKPPPDDSRVTPLSQIIQSEGTAVPGDGDTPTRKRLSLNDYLEKRRKAAVSPHNAIDDHEHVRDANNPVAASASSSSNISGDTEEGQIVE